MKKITRFQRWCKKIKTDRKGKIYIGLDVHKRTNHMAIWHEGQIAISFSMPSDYGHLLRTLKRIPRRIEKIVYEAGPTGYGLARTLKKAGYSVAVIAPSSVLVPRGQHSKSDRLDCRALAEQYAATNKLKEIAIPTPQEESDRQVYRLREHLVKKRKRIKQQIKSFLLQYSLEEPEGLDYWTKASVHQLRKMELPKELSFVRLIMITELEGLDFAVAEVEDSLQEYFTDPRYQDKLEILQSHPAVGPLTALAFCLEIHQPARFGDPKSIAKYVGLAPKTEESGETSRGGSIMKSGKDGLRSKLIEAAWRWIGRDQRARDLYDRLRKNCGKSNIAITGVARHLAIILWRMLLENKKYIKTA